MKRILAVVFAAAFALQMTGCGLLYGVFLDNLMKQEEIFPVSEIHKITASAIVNGQYQEIPEPETFYYYIKSVQEHSETGSETVNMRHFLYILFYLDESPYALSWYGDSLFSWARLNSRLGEIDRLFFMPDNDTAAELRDLMAGYSALGCVLETTAYTINTKHTETNYIPSIADRISSLHDETRYYYGNERTTQLCNFSMEGDAFYYCEETSVRTDAIINNSAYEQQVAFYEYITDGNGRSYDRPDARDVYYPAKQFNGTFEPIPLAKSITEKKYLYTFTVSNEGNEYPIEVWQNEAGTDFCMIAEDSVKAVWSLYKDRDIVIMHAFRTDEIQSGEITGILDDAEKHLCSADDLPYNWEEQAETQARSNADWVKTDTEKYGLFDLSSPPRIGKEVEPTGVVAQWRDYISSGDNPFTLEFRWAGAGRNEYHLTTTDGINYYTRHDMELHDNEEDMGSEEWLIDGRFFQSIYYLKEYQSREILEWDWDDTPRCSLDLLFENEKRNKNYTGTCERAYEVTIGNEQFICEEWSLYLNRLWKVYIKDGNIVAWEGDFHENPTINTVLRLEKTADTTQLTIPAVAKKQTRNG